MKSVTQHEKNEKSADCFRCPVPSDQSRGTIRIGRRKIEASIQDASIEGFTVLIEPKHAKRLAVGVPWKLEYDGALLEIQAQWFFHAPDGRVQVGLRRIRDLTEPERIGTWWPTTDNSRSAEDAGSSTLAFAGFVLVLFVALALPGLGDRLGTAPKIGGAFDWVVDGFRERVNAIW